MAKQVIPHTVTAEARCRTTVLVWTLCLVASWLFLLAMIASVSHRALAPWDVPRQFLPPGAVLPPAPPIGSTAREVNDFFAAPLGAVFPGLVVVLASGLVYCLRYRRAEDWPARLWLVSITAAANLALGLALTILLVSPLSPVVDGRLTTLDLGYHRTWPLALIAGCLCAGLVLFQWRFRVEPSLEGGWKVTIGLGNWFIAKRPGSGAGALVTEEAGPADQGR